MEGPANLPPMGAQIVPKGPPPFPGPGMQPAFSPDFLPKAPPPGLGRGLGTVAPGGCTPKSGPPQPSPLVFEPPPGLSFPMLPHAPELGPAAEPFMGQGLLGPPLMPLGEGVPPPPGFPPPLSAAFGLPVPPPEGPPNDALAAGRPSVGPAAELAALLSGPSGIGPPPSSPPPPLGLTTGSSSSSSAAPKAAGPERPVAVAEPEPPKKRRKGVDGLASNSNIKQGGQVTIYSGYDAVKTSGSYGPPTREPSTALPDTEVAPPPSGAQRVKEALPRQLPEGWEMRQSKSTGKVYYVNEKLGKTQWEPPAGSKLKATQSKKVKATHRSSDPVVEATSSSMNGVMGLVRATESKTGRWQKWQKCSRIVNAPSPEPER